jgi:Phosphatidylinositol 3- and 4-kinase
LPPKRCQELSILDIVTLHVDRHGGNFLLTGDEAQADLVPIDNGLSFPQTPDDLVRMSTSHNAMLGLPGAHEPFTPEMLKKIAKLDPDALKVALKKEVDVIENVHASAKGMVKDARSSSLAARRCSSSVRRPRYRLR